MDHSVTGDIKPTHTISEDEHLGIIRIAMGGFFDRDALAAHISDKKRIIDKWRALGRPICVMIDAVRLKPHSPENQAYVEEAAARIYEPADRVALVVESSLVKMQMRRAMSHGKVANFFISESAAITWLTANSYNSPALLPQYSLDNAVLS